MNYVVGSGPAGVAAASALLDQGLSVTMLDAGGELESQTRSTIARLARTAPDAWCAEDLDTVRGPLRYNTEGAPLKLAFGSDYAYRDVEALQPVAATRVDAYRSFAAGGLSVLWGAAVLPYSEGDLEGWPLSVADMAEHYVAALGMTGLAAEHDALARIYPLYIQPTARLDLSAQARAIADRMAQHADDLAEQQFHVGRARLAVSPPPGTSQGCVHCGMCLYGCPHGLIYSARATLQARLDAFPRAFTYQPGIVVRRLAESRGTVTISAVERHTLRPRQFEAARVYLGAGVLASTAILLESLEAYSQSVLLMQSDHFLLPLLLRASAGSASSEHLHTLSQLFIEVLNPSVSRHSVHLQLYTYNDFYTRMAKDKLGRFYAIAAPVIERLIDRTVLLKGYLHSAESAGITAVLDRDSAGSILRLDARMPERSNRSINALTAIIRKHGRHMGVLPIPLGFRKGLPGSGVHVGGSFPMRHNPHGYEADLLGRPVGFTRVHVVDATVFPTIPAAPPTLTIMANAHRIASLSHKGLEDTACSG